MPITDIHRPGALHEIEAPTQGGLGDAHRGLGHEVGAYNGVRVNPLATGYVRGHDAENSMNDPDGPRWRTVEMAAAIVLPGLSGFDFGHGRHSID